jgi:serine protease Do
VITEINGRPVNNSRDLAQRIGISAPGTNVKLILLRKSQAKTIDLTLGKMPESNMAKTKDHGKNAEDNVPHLGFTLALASDVAGAGGKDVAVVGVDPNSPLLNTV